ncbi:MAG: indole-3-glycerol phosphate synthase TrpC [Kofleriaceae bacterium]|nr:indole-3-glycerol phosphate synthase TrpC [Kofleriaceae bacterium]MBP6837553.1 indole-3-glycerol phosphate synthase TrpC [Kofleriaceae bacterium]
MSAAAPTGILGRIVARKREELATLRAALTPLELAARANEAPPARSLAAALRRGPDQPVRILAEIKRASPSAGPIRPDAIPAEVARDYALHGAAALSVLTDRDFFAGDLAFLAEARMAVDVPILRKDFLIACDQITEARAAGADAVLLIAAALPDAGAAGHGVGPDLAELIACAADLGMDALVEVHDATELERALAAGAGLVGVNHRNLATFVLDLELTAALAPRVPPGVVLVAESGIRTAADVARLGAAGAHAVLVGESLMRAPSPGQALAALRGEPDRGG